MSLLVKLLKKGQCLIWCAPFVPCLFPSSYLEWENAGWNSSSHFMNMLLLLLLNRFSCVWLCVTPYSAAHQAPPSLGFSRQEHWSGLPFPSPMHESEKWQGSRSVVSDSSRPHGLQPTRLLRPWDFPGKSTGVGCHCLLRTPRLPLFFLTMHPLFQWRSGSPTYPNPLPFCSCSDS